MAHTRNVLKGNLSVRSDKIDTGRVLKYNDEGTDGVITGAIRRSSTMTPAPYIFVWSMDQTMP